MVSFRERVVLFQTAGQFIHRQVSVTFRGRETGVSQKLLKRAQIRTAAEKVSGEGVS